jgi:hypothetical protein
LVLKPKWNEFKQIIISSDNTKRRICGKLSNTEVIIKYIQKKQFKNKTLQSMQHKIITQVGYEIDELI